jgi:hypothetical protein
MRGACLVVLVGLAISSVAAAQPDPNGPPPAPASEMQPPPPPPGPPASQPVYRQPPPIYTAPPPPLLRQGMTFEANLGFGFIHASSGGVSDNSDASLGGLDLGIGGWLGPRSALPCASPG